MTQRTGEEVMRPGQRAGAVPVGLRAFRDGVIRHIRSVSRGQRAGGERWGAHRDIRGERGGVKL